MHHVVPFRPTRRGGRQAKQTSPGSTVQADPCNVYLADVHASCCRNRSNQIAPDIVGVIVELRHCAVVERDHQRQLLRVGALVSWQADAVEQRAAPRCRVGVGRTPTDQKGRRAVGAPRALQTVLGQPRAHWRIGA